MTDRDAERFEGFEMEAALRINAAKKLSVEGFIEVNGLPGIIVRNRSFNCTIALVPNPATCDMPNGQYRGMFVDADQQGREHA